jgi:multicomponent Na+:H+ antiporter subunit B
MSRKRDQLEYEKSWAYRFWRWLGGSKDPYIGSVEMQVQKEHDLSEEQRDEFNRQRLLRSADRMEKLENQQLTRFMGVYKVLGVVFCLALIFLLVLTISYLPETGNANNPDNNEVAKVYIENGLQDTGAVNIVTGMILSYRAFDTFGETNVLFIAASCVMILLMVSEEKLLKLEKKNDRRYEPKNDVILQTAAKILCPVIFMFGFYVMVNGHLSPGGGFSGGAMTGAGLILYVSAFGFEKMERFFNEKVYKVVKVASLCTYGVMITYYFIMGANGWENHIPLGKAGAILSSGLILPINICVGLEVACTMYAFYALFRRGGL